MGRGFDAAFSQPVCGRSSRGRRLRPRLSQHDARRMRGQWLGGRRRRLERVPGGRTPAAAVQPGLCLEQAREVLHPLELTRAARRSRNIDEIELASRRAAGSRAIFNPVERERGGHCGRLLFVVASFFAIAISDVPTSPSQHRDGSRRNRGGSQSRPRCSCCNSRPNRELPRKRLTARR